MLKKNLNKKFEQGHQQHYFCQATLEQLYTALYKVINHFHSDNTRSALYPYGSTDLVFIVCVLIQAMTRSCMLDLSASRHLVMVIRMMANDLSLIHI